MLVRIVELYLPWDLKQSEVNLQDIYNNTFDTNYKYVNNDNADILKNTISDYDEVTTAETKERIVSAAIRKTAMGRKGTMPSTISVVTTAATSAAAAPSHSILSSKNNNTNHNVTTKPAL